ncbi:MAG: DUF1549 domain-containing protein [Balneolales bacterium]
MILDSLSELWLWQLLGRLHPLVVHFPIGVLVTAFILEVLTFGGNRAELRTGIRWLVYIGAGTSVLAALVGLLLAYGGNYPASTLNYHRWLGIVTVALALLAAGLLHRARSGGRPADLNLYRGVLALTVLFLTVAGHLGSSLTHGSDYLTSVLPWNNEAPSRGETGALLTELAVHRELGRLEEPHLNKLNQGVRRIFAHSCYRCHDSDEADGDLALDSQEGVMAGGEGGPVVMAGRPDDSELLRRLLLPGGHDDVMPQKGRSLHAEEVELIRLWIELGAHWPDEETGTFREAELALDKPEVPEAGPELEQPIDRFVHVYFEEQGLSWPEPVNDANFMRRVHMDLIGLLPEPEEVRAFASDPAPDKRERMIDSLLSRDHDYAQHWLSFWNDLLRNDYSGTGYIDGGRKQITDWLYDALQYNKPYNAMVRELINPDEGSEGFIKGIQWRGDFNASQSTEMQAAQNISQSMLGLNMKCASCHNSFTSNLTLDQAYSFAAVFSDTLLAVERCDVPTGDHAEPGFIYKELGDIDATLPKLERLVKLAEIVAQEKNGRLYRTIANRFWARLMGQGLVEPVDEMDVEPWNQDLLDWLAADLIDQEYDLKYLLSSILNSRTYQLPSVAAGEDQANGEDVFRGPLRKRLTAEQFADALGQVAAPVYQSVAFDPYDSRNAEAEWIWYNARQDGRNSLPEPGLYYFRHAFDIPAGRAIKEAQLLISVDQAFELFLNGTSVGRGQDWRDVARIDVTSQLNRGGNILAVEGENGGTTPNPAGMLLNLRVTFVDGGVEEVRSGRDWKVRNQKPGPGWEGIGFDDSGWEAVRSYGNRAWGRLIDFTHDQAGERLRFARASLVNNDPFLTALGRPAREIVHTGRDPEVTLLQALTLTNGEFFNGVLQRGAGLWIDRYGEDPEELVRQIYLSAFGRVPTDREKEVAGGMLAGDPGREAVQDLLWAVVMQPEFQYIH